MTDHNSIDYLRDAIRANTLADESLMAQRLLADADIGAGPRERAQSAAKSFVVDARANAARSGLIDKFLQEYGLSTAEGVTLMRLAEALLRTPDAATADALIEDKIEAGDWGSHKGKSPFPLINFSTRALMFTAAWLDDIEEKDSARKMVAGTKKLLDRIGEPVIRASVAQAMRIMGEHFVLGQTIEEAHQRGAKFNENGYLFSFDMLGEAAHTQADALKYFNDYANAIAAIAKNVNSNNAHENPGISVKLSALHPRYEYGKKDRVLKELGARVRDLALASKNANIGFNIDAEEADRLDISLDLIEMLMRDPALAGWDGFGVVVQSYQRRARFVLDWLIALARETNMKIMVRLVKGAYWDGEVKRAQVMGLESYPVFTRKVLTDVSYIACARQLLENTDVIYPQFATHNALTATMVREMAGDPASYELQRLHGMGEALHDTLIKDGIRSRIYAPVGGHKELLPYLVRRLLENGANSSFVNQLIDPDLSIEDVVADPIDEASLLNILPNPAIPAPRDLFSGTRQSAKGWDETDPSTAAHLQKVVQGSPPDLHSLNNEHVLMYGDLDESASHYDVVNPTTGAVTKCVVSTPEMISNACSAAKNAQPDWANRSDRGDILRNCAISLEQNADQFFHLATNEAGKTIPDGIAEIREAIDFLNYYANQADDLINTDTNKPLGVVACISPWNFPLAIFLGQVSAALAAGNTVVAKPAEQTPGIALQAVRLMHLAGIPEDVLHILPGDGPNVGAPLIANEHVAGVVFTGSTRTAQSINRALSDAGKWDAPLIAETGGINAMIIDSTALLEQATSDVIASAFQSAGQRCSACRLVCVQDDIAHRFEEMLSGAMAELSISDPAYLATDIGPVIDQNALETILTHTELMRKTARVIAEAPTINEDVPGTFVRPIAFEISAISDLNKEVFGPVLHVFRFKAKDLDAVLQEINDLGFGLTMGIHTRIDETMEKISSSACVGNIYVNRNQIGAVVGVQPFGGEGLSGTGPKAGGPHYVNMLTKPATKDGTSDLPISEAPIDPGVERALTDLRKNYLWWSNCKDKAAIFMAAAAKTHGELKECLQKAATIYDDHFDKRTELPGPTGESNALRLRGRGIVACLGGDAPFDQLAKSLAAGNLIISDSEISRSLAESFSDTVPDIVIGENFSNGISSDLLLSNAIGAISFDGSVDTKKKLTQVLAKRTGAIIPLLSGYDDAHRYAVERTLTINTTAAGGDVRLLSLPE